MINVIETNSSMTNDKEVDFQSRTFKYESFDKLVKDFEGSEVISVKGSMLGVLRPQNLNYECLFKSDFHVMYKLIDPNVRGYIITRFYTY